MCRPLWYLTEEMVALALFYDEENTTLDEKVEIVSAMNAVDSTIDEKRLSLNLQAFLLKDIHNFASKFTKNFFARLEISRNFWKNSQQNGIRMTIFLKEKRL